MVLVGDPHPGADVDDAVPVAVGDLLGGELHGAGRLVVRGPELQDGQRRDEGDDDDGSRRNEQRRPAFQGASRAPLEQPAPGARGLGRDALGAGEVGGCGRGVEGSGAAAGQGQVAARGLEQFVLEVEPA